MGVEPSSQVGQLSPDGMWRWDGRQWILAGAPGERPRTSRRWLWWVAAGCSVLILLGLVGAVAGGKALFDRFQHGGFACLPSDFPRYPGATVSSESTYTGTITFHRRSRPQAAGTAKLTRLGQGTRISVVLKT